jgi:prepilin-type N-terminal cleavage/methylation domain-containing protein
MFKSHSQKKDFNQCSAKSNHGFTRSNRGFTLIEILVSTAIFAIVLSALTAAFVYISQLQRRTNAIRAANDNVRYVSDFLSKEIRNGSLLPVSSPSLGPCSDYLATKVQSYNWLQIVNVNGDQECFYLGTAGSGNNPGSLSLNGPELWIVKQPAGTASALAAQSLNLSAAQITNLTFTVENYNPTNPSLQPFVTIQGTVVSNKDPQDVVSVPFETSITLQTIE